MLQYILLEYCEQSMKSSISLMDYFYETACNLLCNTIFYTDHSRAMCLKSRYFLLFQRTRWSTKSQYELFTKCYNKQSHVNERLTVATIDEQLLRSHTTVSTLNQFVPPGIVSIKSLIQMRMRVALLKINLERLRIN